MGRRLFLLVAAALGATGLFAISQSIAGGLLPHDEAWLGLTTTDLSGYHGGRIVRFMIHDRASFGGTLVAISCLYAWLVHEPLARGERWAWWAILASGSAGFASFLAYLGYGYLDTWHGLATLLLLPVFVGGLALTRASAVSGPILVVAGRLGVAPRAGHALITLASGGMLVAGLVILGIGATMVFVPQDLAYIGAGVDALGSIHPGLVPLIAHDRAGFGGGLVATGIAALAVSVRGEPSAGRWTALAGAGLAGFGAAIAVHLAVGYTDPSHLGPAVAGAAVLAAGLVLSAPHDLVGSFSLRPRRLR